MDVNFFFKTNLKVAAHKIIICNKYMKKYILVVKTN